MIRGRRKSFPLDKMIPLFKHKNTNFQKVGDFRMSYVEITGSKKTLKKMHKKKQRARNKTLCYIPHLNI